MDTPSYVSRTGHRWSSAQRDDVEARWRAGQNSTASAAYVSAANPYPIYSWRPAWLWALALALAAILVASAFQLRV
jgi:hypothetical protein